MKERYVLALKRGRIVYVSGDPNTMQVVRRAAMSLRDSKRK